MYDVNVKIKEGIAIDKSATSLRAQKLAKQAVKVTMPSDSGNIPQDTPKVNKQSKQSNTKATRNIEFFIIITILYPYKIKWISGGEFI